MAKMKKASEMKPSDPGPEKSKAPKPPPYPNDASIRMLLRDFPDQHSWMTNWPAARALQQDIAQIRQAIDGEKERLEKASVVLQGLEQLKDTAEQMLQSYRDDIIVEAKTCRKLFYAHGCTPEVVKRIQTLADRLANDKKPEIPKPPGPVLVNGDIFPEVKEPTLPGKQIGGTYVEDTALPAVRERYEYLESLNPRLLTPEENLELGRLRKGFGEPAKITMDSPFLGGPDDEQVTEPQDAGVVGVQRPAGSSDSQETPGTGPDLGGEG